MTFKLAQSLNGKIARKNGESVALTGEPLAKFTHQHRKQSDVILTTAATINNDNPWLNVRLDHKLLIKPLAVLDRKLKIAQNIKQLHCIDAIETIFHGSSTKLNDSFLKAQHVAINTNGNKLDLLEILKYLGQQGYHDVWVEAGGKLFTSLMKQQLVQRLYLYISPCWLADSSIDAYIDSKDIGLSEALNVQWQQKGQDVLAKFEWLI